MVPKPDSNLMDFLLSDGLALCEKPECLGQTGFLRKEKKIEFN
jgi:hypothetical protein